MEKTTWRKEILEEMEKHNDSFDNVIAQTKSNFDRVFDAEFGSDEAKDFTLWTKTRVYFPMDYDGSKWAGSVPRFPD